MKHEERKSLGRWRIEETPRSDEAPTRSVRRVGRFQVLEEKNYNAREAYGVNEMRLRHFLNREESLFANCWESAREAIGQHFRGDRGKSPTRVAKRGPLEIWSTLGSEIERLIQSNAALDKENRRLQHEISALDGKVNLLRACYGRASSWPPAQRVGEKRYSLGKRSLSDRSIFVPARLDHVDA